MHIQHKNLTAIGIPNERCTNQRRRCQIERSHKAAHNFLKAGLFRRVPLWQFQAFQCEWHLCMNALSSDSVQIVKRSSQRFMTCNQASQSSLNSVGINITNE
ncbi:hypothetical protein D3C77_277360 [compost metagenome]